MTLSIYSVVGENRELLFNLSVPEYSVDTNVDYDDLHSDGPKYKKMNSYMEKTSSVVFVDVSGDTLYIAVAHNVKNNLRLISVDMSKREATYTPIASEEGVAYIDFQLCGDDIYSLLHDNEKDIYFVAKLVM